MTLVTYDGDIQDMFVDMTKPHPTGEEAGGGNEKPADQHETTFSLDQHASSKASEGEDGKPAIDSKPQIRIRNPPGGKSSIFF